MESKNPPKLKWIMPDAYRHVMMVPQREKPTQKKRNIFQVQRKSAKGEDGGRETMIEEEKWEENSLIYTLKNLQILPISTKLSIEGKEAIYWLFFFILPFLWCMS